MRATIKYFVYDLETGEHTTPLSVVQICEKLGCDDRIPRRYAESGKSFGGRWSFRLADMPQKMRVKGASVLKDWDDICASLIHSGADLSKILIVEERYDRKRNAL